jgi:hypothetical protein
MLFEHIQTLSIPRRQQSGVIQKMAVLLRPGGIVVATMGIRSIKALYEHDWIRI